MTQALKGENLSYHKTQYINHYDMIIDTPGEYSENKKMVRAVLLYSFEADVVGLMASSMEEYTLYPPNIVYLATRPVIGIVTQIDRPNCRPDWAELYLRLAGCKKIFWISSVTGEGIPDLMDYLRDPGDEFPWDNDPEFWAKRQKDKEREVQLGRFGFDRLK